MAVQGFVRLRKHQFGKQTSFTSNTTATRALPFRGAIVYDPQRESPDVDEGSIDPVLAPFNGASSITSSLEGPLAYNDAPYLWAALLKGGVTATGATAKSWTFQAASLTADDFEFFTHEWGDDAQNIIGGSAVLDGLELSFDEGLGAFQTSQDWVHARALFGTGLTGGLTIDDSPTWVYGADTEVYLDTVYSSIGTTKLTDSVRGVSVQIAPNLDQKRYANGSNTRFQLAAYGRGAREVTVTITAEEQAAILTEVATLDDDPVPNRYIEVRTTSPVIITGATPYSHVVRVPARLINVEYGEIGGNATITLTYRGFYDSDLGYAIRAVVVNTLASL
jgi:hypothetical protein